VTSESDIPEETFMSRRYYICDLIGTGSDVDPVRPAVDDLGVNYAIVRAPDPAARWCLVVVATTNHARVAAARGVDALPDVSLDVQANSIDKSKFDSAKAALARRGATVPATAPGDGFRVFLRGIGRQLEPTFDEANFDVADVGG
jgi:hypothetical protein